MRLLTNADIPQALGLSEAAGWNQTAADWSRFLTLAADSAFGIETDGMLASSGGAVCYGQELAWVGMVLTLPGFRGQGFARRILEHILDHLDRRGVSVIRLDGTDDGRPLYRSLGFADEYRVERWMRAAAPSPPVTLPPFALDAALDREAFGADRTRLLRLLAAEESTSAADGFALGRRGGIAAFFGPCVSRSVKDADAMARWFVGHHQQESIFWDLVPEHPAAGIASSLGFSPRRGLTRMVRGAPVSRPSPLVYGHAGFEFG